VRVWKGWLAERANADAEIVMTGEREEIIEIDVTSKGKKALHDNVSTNEKDIQADSAILWIDASRHVGLRVRVTEKKWQTNMPILIHADEEACVSYELEYKELLVRTSHLLLVLEKNAQEQDTNSGKAVVFGSFG